MSSLSRDIHRPVDTYAHNAVIYLSLPNLIGNPIITSFWFVCVFLTTLVLSIDTPAPVISIHSSPPMDHPHPAAAVAAAA